MKPTSEYHVAQQRDNLCFRCGHYDVCEMAGAVLRVESTAKLRYFAVISQCAHHEAESTGGAQTEKAPT